KQAPARTPAQARTLQFRQCSHRYIRTFLDTATHQHFFELADGMRRVQSFWTDVRAIHDRVAAEQAVWIFQIVQTLARCFVTRVGNETIGLQQTSRTDELVGVPPERWASGRAAGAQNALVQTIELLTGF